MTDRLAEILAHKREEVASAKVALSAEDLRAQVRDCPPTRGFRLALERDPRSLALIAEVKKASPSQGVIRPEFNPVAIALEYQRAGVTCLSVLTDQRFFQGSPDALRQVRAAVDLPILRKDFTVDAYQVFEARLWGADAILLIVAALTDDELRRLSDEARSLDLDVLVEVHDDAETDRAMALGANLIGVNNRNLATFQTDLATSERLLPRIAPHALAVSESALATPADLSRVAAAGARAVLIGTTFCASPDIEMKVREVMGW